MAGTEIDGPVTVSVIVRDAQGFTYHYDDFVTDSAHAERALEILAETQQRPSSSQPTGTVRSFFNRALGTLVNAVG